MDDTTINLHRMVVWGCLAQAWRPPGSPFPLADELPAAARALGLDAQPLLDALAGAAGLAEAHDRLLGHTVRGDCPAYEGEYGEPKGFRFAHEIGDVSGFYRAFGLRPSRQLGERADHIAVECEFMAFLALKEACARQVHGEEKARLCRDASRKFLHDHLGHFGRSFASRVRRKGGHPFYLAAAGLLDEAIRSDAGLFGLPVAADDLPLREDAGTPEDACVQCGVFKEAPR